MDRNFKLPLIVKGDVDGFFGLMVDNLVQILIIIFLCQNFCGMTGKYSYLIYARILPGAALSILFGNLFYAWQARRLAKREGRTDVCAMPHGIHLLHLLLPTAQSASTFSHREHRGHREKNLI